MNAMSKAIDNIIKAAPPLQADDYIGNDGLMYCGKCHTRRQMRIELLGEMRTVPIMCDCLKAEAQEEEARRACRSARPQATSMATRASGCGEHL